MHYGLKLKRDDKRIKKYAKQRKQRGFDDTETWSLDQTVAKFVLPRLKRFKEVNNGFPALLKSDEWDAILDKMIDGFECVLKRECWALEYTEDQKEWKKVDKRARDGLRLFAKHFRELWW